MKQFLKWDYKYAGLAALSLVVALILYIFGLQHGAGYLLAVTSGLQTIPLIVSMISSLIKGEIGIDLLAVTAIVSAIIAHEYLTAAIIVLMLTGGEALEDYGEHRAKSELTALVNKAPKVAHLKISANAKKSQRTEIHQIKVGSIIVIRPGEIVPIDSKIVSGKSSFDESAITGESLPIDKIKGDEILSGSVNTSGLIVAKTLRRAQDSQYEQIIQLVDEASSSRSPYVRMADRYSVVFTIVAFTIAGFAWYFSGEFIRFLEVLVVATPCPLLLAAPIALVSGMSRSAKEGIIIKSGAAIEKFSRIKTMAFDKTGTLTYGQPQIKAIKTSNGFSKDEILGLAAAMEANSNHVLAEVIVNESKTQKIKVPKISNVHELAGFGIQASYNRKSVLLGKASLMTERGIKIAKNLRQNHTATYIVIDGLVAGVIIFVDEVRSNAHLTIKQLRALGIKYILMLTGDNFAAASAIAKTLEFKEFHSDLLPNDKLAALKNLDDKHLPVAFVGDGVNDAPSLAAADVGIALGAKGATAASQSADIVIMLDDINRVAHGLAIAKRTFKIARQSILVGIALSIVLMFIFSTGHFRPVYGAVIQEVVDVIVIFNALRAHFPGRHDIFLNQISD